MVNTWTLQTLPIGRRLGLSLQYREVNLNIRRGGFCEDRYFCFGRTYDEPLSGLPKIKWRLFGNSKRFESNCSTRFETRNQHSSTGGIMKFVTLILTLRERFHCETLQKMSR
jgi:hypothetical protein